MFYDEDYYERGIETGKSCYSNYRWMPEQTIPMAMVMVDYLGIKRGQTVLDFGCSKGYLVKALRLLGRDACGVDVSDYAISNCDPQVKNRCVIKAGQYFEDIDNFDFCIAKDVFEHIEEEDIQKELNRIRANKMLAVIPLGENGMYRAPSNNLDKSHKICKSEQWWVDTFNKSGWALESYTLRIAGIKDSYYEKYPDSHGFFTVVKK